MEQAPNGINGHAQFQPTVELLDHDCVLIVGGGPVGLVLSTTLASYGVKCIVLERNQSTTKSAIPYDRLWISTIEQEQMAQNGPYECALYGDVPKTWSGRGPSKTR